MFHVSNPAVIRMITSGFMLRRYLDREPSGGSEKDLPYVVSNFHRDHSVLLATQDGWTFIQFRVQIEKLPALRIYHDFSMESEGGGNRFEEVNEEQRTRK